MGSEEAMVFGSTLRPQESTPLATEGIDAEATTASKFECGERAHQVRLPPAISGVGMLNNLAAADVIPIGQP